MGGAGRHRYSDMFISSWNWGIIILARVTELERFIFLAVGTDDTIEFIYLNTEYLITGILYIE